MKIDYDSLFSEDTRSFVASPAREIFKKVDIDKIYSLSGGYPAPESFPLESLGHTMQDVIARYGAKAFQYSGTQGVLELRQALSERYGQPLERIQITTASQQGIDVSARVLIDPGDVVLTSDPTYIGALQSFKSYRAELVGVPPCPDIDGFRSSYVEAIENIRKAGKRLKMMYMIPDFQNPSGETLSLEERHVLADLADEYGFVIVEDCPYKSLRYEGEDLPSIYSMAPDRVIHLGSFSKIMCPGFRLGWLFAAPELISKIYVCKQALDLTPPVFDQYVAAEFITSGRLDANLKRTVALYKEKRDIMLEELEHNLPSCVRWSHPEGGLFVFLTLPESFDAVAFYDTAFKAGVAYVAGNMFFTEFVAGVHGTKTTSKVGLNTIRLNYSFLPAGRLREGVRMFCSLISDALK